jgi:WhiB family redox-sensing transcriptional regulator
VTVFPREHHLDPTTDVGYGVLLGLPAMPDWMRDALCAEVDSEIFYPEKGGSTREAKSICAECLVRAECLDYALATGQRFGIWGMRSERERRRLLGLPDDDEPEEASAA